MAAPLELTEADLAAITDPDVLLSHAWDLEPWSRYVERAAVLDRLEALLAGETQIADPPPGRNWRLELLAERAIDIGRSGQVQAAVELVDEIVAAAAPGEEIALGRTMLASGQAFAWLGTEESIRRARRDFAEAADRFAALGRRDWQGSALLRWGYSACYQYGDVVEAERLMRQAIETYEPGSERLPTALTPYADTLIDTGELDRAEEIFDRAQELAERDGIFKAIPEIMWGRARVAAARGDARATERLVHETERDAVKLDWWSTNIGLTFLLEAAEMLDRLGVADQAQVYFERGRERVGDDNEEVMHARAVMLARSGDPAEALERLQALVRGSWIEKRHVWRHTLLTGWATFRAGRDGAGELAALALKQAAAGGTVKIALAGERDIAMALAGEAERSGSAHARELLLGDRKLLVRLFGTPSVRTPAGEELTLPPGMPGKLVRLLALNEHGLPVDVVLETFFPDAPATAARQRLRQVLTRLRSAAGELIVREDETLRLVPAWVDVREFLAASNRVRGARGARAVQLAYGALALRAGPLLPSDPYDEWAEETRAQVRYRELALLDLIAGDAATRGSHQEALTALESALELDPGDDQRQRAVGEQARALGRHRAAGHVERSASRRQGD